MALPVQEGPADGIGATGRAHAPTFADGLARRPGRRGKLPSMPSTKPMPSQPEVVQPHPEAELPQPEAVLPVRRPRGRPRKPNAFAGDGGLTREAIIQRAKELAQVEPLDEISTVRLAQAFGVVPGLIRYHVGSRDDLLTGVLNQYFRERMASIPQPTGEWRADVMAFARATMASMLRYPGIAQYIGRHNRFRLFQKVDPGEVDYGLEFFNQFACVLMQGGLSRKAVATGYHLLMLFLVASANSEIGRMEPAPGAARAGGHYPSPNRSLKRSAASALPLGLDAVPRGYSSAMRSSQ